MFESSLHLARESGYLKRRSMKVALDTTNILGRGVVKDTYNLLADRMVKLMRRWRRLRESASGNGPRPGDTGGASPPASRGGNHRLVGQAGPEGTAGRDWETRTGCWSWRVRRRGGWRRTERSVSG